MFLDPDLLPSDPGAAVEYLGPIGAAGGLGDDEDQWQYLGVVIAERTLQPDEPEWRFSSDVSPTLDPGLEGLWSWGDVLIQVEWSTILESRLTFYRREEAADA